jgi:hypothetical protein
MKKKMQKNADLKINWLSQKIGLDKNSRFRPLCIGRIYRGTNRRYWGANKTRLKMHSVLTRENPRLFIYRKTRQVLGRHCLW